jgi:hypothetical protein
MFAPKMGKRSLLCSVKYSIFLRKLEKEPAKLGGTYYPLPLKGLAAQTSRSSSYGLVNNSVREIQAFHDSRLYAKLRPETRFQGVFTGPPGNVFKKNQRTLPD